jgi:signal transduction histidine kinase
LFSSAVRDSAQQARAANGKFEDIVSAVVHGDRIRLRVLEKSQDDWSSGLAIDVSDVEQARIENERILRSHQETLDQLTTAVAIFDEKQKLRFCNQAFQKLWDLEPAFIDNHPAHAEVLDRLRSDDKLAEQPDWRNWKDQMLRVYRAIEATEDWWHLPDGKTIRVIANPHPRGGVTLIFENLTEKIDLESRNKTLIRLQGETLGNLAEGVAVFGSDGRVRLSNPAFARLWKIPAETVVEGAHIRIVKAAADVQFPVSPWADFVAAVTGFDDDRADRFGQSECSDGSVVSYSLVPLPNAQVMITVIDVTDTINVERALKEKNDALQRADELKNSFVQHMSYELRSPLTNIIGFADMLRMPVIGELNERQADYVDHISDSSATLLAIVNDILDLATLDAGIMQLDVSEVAVGEIVGAAATQMSNRLREHALKLDVSLPDDIGTFVADSDRVRQILVNLLSNAANYAPEGSAVTLSAWRDKSDIVFSVADKGPGIPQEVVASVYRRFEPHSKGARRRGAGLGLSIVKSFMDLHGGTVDISTSDGGGTTVTCRFPARPDRFLDAAE